MRYWRNSEKIEADALIIGTKKVDNFKKNRYNIK